MYGLFSKVTKEYNESTDLYIFRGSFGQELVNYLTRLVSKSRLEIIFKNRNIASGILEIYGFFLPELEALFKRLLEFPGTYNLNMHNIKTVVDMIEDIKKSHEVKRESVDYSKIKNHMRYDIMDIQKIAFERYSEVKSHFAYKGFLLDADTGTGKTSMSVSLAKGVGADMKDSKQEVSPQTNTEPPVKIKPTLAEVMNERNKSMYKMQPDGSYPDDRSAEELDYLTKLTEAFDSSFRDGGGLAAFYVDYSGSVTESFSNSTGEIGLTGLVKSIGGKARDIKFNLAGGELGAGVKNLLDYGTDVLMGALDSVSFGLSSVLASLMGGGFIHAPKKWEDSDISLPTITYTAQLRSSTPDIIHHIVNRIMNVSVDDSVQ
jgi:hypothetical protein